MDSNLCESESEWRVLDPFEYFFLRKGWIEKKNN